jgi:hypothetical protein
VFDDISLWTIIIEGLKRRGEEEKASGEAGVWGRWSGCVVKMER